VPHMPIGTHGTRLTRGVNQSRSAGSTMYAGLACTPGWASSSRPTGCQPTHGCAQASAQYSSHHVDNETRKLGCQRLPRPGLTAHSSGKLGRGGTGRDYAAATPTHGDGLPVRSLTAHTRHFQTAVTIVMRKMTILSVTKNTPVHQLLRGE